MLDSDKYKIGLEGEDYFRNYLKSIGASFGQIDIIFKIDNKWYSVEVKHQEMFEAPPFDGHGLPIWQIKFRMEFYEATGVIPLFVVLDKKTKVMYYNTLINLEKGEKFTTKNSKRVIYPIENFKVIEYQLKKIA